jgi:hypothetical protein
MNRAYPGSELRVGGLAGRPHGHCPAPVVEARASDAEDGAQPLHAVAALVVLGELSYVLLQRGVLGDDALK